MSCLSACKIPAYIGHLQKEHTAYSVAPISLASGHFLTPVYCEGQVSKDHTLGNPVLKSYWNCPPSPHPTSLHTQYPLSRITR